MFRVLFLDAPPGVRGGPEKQGRVENGHRRGWKDSNIDRNQDFRKS